MSFDLLTVALELVVEVAKVYPKIAKHDGDLAKQVRRSANSVPANVGEGSWRKGADQAHFYRTAGGSAKETTIHLLVARSWGFVTNEEIAPSLARADRVCAMVWKATH